MSEIDHVYNKQAQELLDAADEEERAGDRLKGCSWAGRQPPWAGHYSKADMLRQAAHLLLAKRSVPNV